MFPSGCRGICGCPRGFGSARIGCRKVESWRWRSHLTALYLKIQAPFHFRVDPLDPPGERITVECPGGEMIRARMVRIRKRFAVRKPKEQPAALRALSDRHRHKRQLCGPRRSPIPQAIDRGAYLPPQILRRPTTCNSDPSPRCRGDRVELLIA